MVSGRLPITVNNIEIITEQSGVSSKKLVNEISFNAGLTIIGFLEENLKYHKEKLFQGYGDVGNILFINSHDQKLIE